MRIDGSPEWARTLLVPLVLSFGVYQASAQQQSYRGSEGQVSVAPPRLETTAEIDGVLDDAVWSQAAILSGFSQYQPVDGRPAEERTEVYVWYAPEAIYFGIRAEEAHGDVVRATRANRDNIASEDQVHILLDTADDRRTAFLFAVNPLGVQADGTRSDAFGGGAGGRSATGGGMMSINFMDGNTDLNPDFVFQSAGRLTEFGFEIEVRIPFKSLRYQDKKIQNWGLHILRRSMHSGFQDSWAPAIRANASFLGQSGELVGLHDLKRGLVLEVTPTLTGRLDGSEDEDSGDWTYDGAAEPGADVKWGIRQNLTFNGTINPDFSQVEADVGQVALNERFALFFPEKRPFFLDGLELFDTPNQLIYTRQIAEPIAGAKLAGEIGEFNVATILAVDDRNQSASGHDNPLFSVTRLRRNLSRSATVGGVLTAREEGGDYSRLIGADTRLYHDEKYYVELQAVRSMSSLDGETAGGSLLEAAWDRTGRAFGFHWSVKAISPDFQAAGGFVNRTDLLEFSGGNRYTIYRPAESALQTVSVFGRFSRLWSWSDPEAGAIEGGESIFPSATFRGGWNMSLSAARSFFAYHADDYGGYALDGGESFTVPGIEDNQWSGTLRLTTPTWRTVTANASYGVGRTPIFAEASPGRRSSISGTIDLRPTQGLRATFQMTRLVLHRRADDSRYSAESIPRLKVEYQVTPAIFLRVISQYVVRDRSGLLDRDLRAIVIDGEAAEASSTNRMQLDWLFSYRPIPGTLLYLGYGSQLEESEAFRFRDTRRVADGFFAKVSYRIRV